GGGIAHAGHQNRACTTRGLCGHGNRPRSPLESRFRQQRVKWKMAWNEPGKDQDPWGGKSNNGDGPPDLDQIWQRLRARLSKKRGGGKNGGSGGGGGPQLNPALLLWLIPVIVVI